MTDVSTDKDAEHAALTAIANSLRVGHHIADRIS